MTPPKEHWGKLVINPQHIAGPYWLVEKRTSERAKVGVMVVLEHDPTLTNVAHHWGALAIMKRPRYGHSTFETWSSIKGVMLRFSGNDRDQLARLMFLAIKELVDAPSQP